MEKKSLLPIALTMVAAFLAAGSVTAQGATTVISDAVEHPGREADRVDDGNRKPGEVLDFFGIEAGMRVLDLLAGGGYYTEILSRVVGDEGSVIFHNNATYRQFLGEALAKRTAGSRLANVEVLDDEVADLELEDGPNVPKIQRYYSPRASGCKELLGFEAKIGLEEGIKETVQWYLENR